MLFQSHQKNLGSLFYSGVSGVLLAMAFPKAGLSLLAWVAFVPFFAVLRDLKPRQSFFSGLVFGIFHFLCLVYWVTNTLNVYGKLPMALCLPILGLLVFYLALYPAIFAMLLSRYCKNPKFLIVLGPALWVALEFIRTFALSGFPWELLGYSQALAPYIVQSADITGVYGISFVIVMVNTALFLAFLIISKKTWQSQRLSTRVSLAQIVSTAIVLSLVAVYGFQRIKQVDQWSSNGPTLTVSVIQGNIDQSLKWSPDYQQETLFKYNRLSFLASRQHPDLIVWPETAAPFYYGNDRPLTELLKQGISRTETPFIIGAPSFTRKQNRFQFFNTAFLLDKKGELLDAYSKVHLVPFGEYVPFQRFLPFINKLTEQTGDFYTGREGQTLDIGSTRTGVQICFEVIFSHLSRSMVLNKAKLLVNITNDAWFGKSSAPFQHFSMVVFRAVENRRSIARAANTGISGFIDPCGRVRSATDLFTDAHLTETLPLIDHLTIYTRYGDWFAILCFALLFLALPARRIPEQNPRKARK